jgi:fructosamine-3-kinase
MTINQVDPTDRRQMFYWQVDRPFDPIQTKEIFLDRYSHISPDAAISAIESGLIAAGFAKKDAQVASIHPPGKILSSVNVIFYVTLVTGKEIIIRIHPPETKNGYFWAESVAATLAKKNGVPSYSTYFIDDTKTKFPFDFMIIERLPGETMQLLWPLSDELDRKLVGETGKYLALIHQVKTQKYGFFDNNIAKKSTELVGLHNEWREHIFAAYDKNLQFLTDNQVITKDQRKTIEKIFSTHESVIECNSPRLIHNDIADWNQLTFDNHVSGILDWDECFSGDPVMDFAAWSVFFPYTRMQYLVDGYKQISDLPEGYEEKLHLYRLRYIISKSVSRKTKIMVTPNPRYQEMLDYALKILVEEFKWYGV